MTLYYRTKAFVFKKEDRSEADRIFSAFTQDFGRIDILGKAIRKIHSKLRGGIELFTLSDITFIQGKNIKKLTDANFVEKFGSIAQIPEKFEIAAAIARTIDCFIRGEEKDEGIFDILHQVFSILNKDTFDTKLYWLVYYYFMWNFFSVLGHRPELSVCAVCRQKLNPYHLYFSNREGGVICKNCSLRNQEALKIKSDTVKILRLILQKDWDIVARLKIEASFKKSFTEVSNYYSQYLLLTYSKQQ